MGFFLYAIPHIMGLFILFTLLVNNRIRFFAPYQDVKYLRLLMIVAACACILDPLSYWFDGKPGTLAFLMVYSGNLLLYASNLFVGPLWIILIMKHLNIQLYREQHIFLFSTIVGGIGLLVLNFFTPLVFTVSETNVYQRGLLFWVFLVLEFVYIADGILIYYLARKKGGETIFFPVKDFCIPLVFGIVIQAAVYGISMIWPCMAISISGITSGFQNEYIYIDNLTGAFNRYYLDYMKRVIKRKRNGTVTAMMMDLNNFKSINDRYGHSVGDQALIKAAEIIRRNVGSRGRVIRYAGDEFLAILDIQNTETAESIISGIHQEMEQWNLENPEGFQLSISIGYCMHDLKTQTVDELMNEVDKRMYEEKKKYYADVRVNRRANR